jgi:hypothetical protein
MMEHYGTNFLISEAPYQVLGPGRWTVTGQKFMFYPEEERPVLIKAGSVPVYIGGSTTEDGFDRPFSITPGRSIIATLLVNDGPRALGIWEVNPLD